MCASSALHPTPSATGALAHAHAHAYQTRKVFLVVVVLVLILMLMAARARAHTRGRNDVRSADDHFLGMDTLLSLCSYQRRRTHGCYRLLKSVPQPNPNRCL
jgi:hypothetical protein